MKALDISIALWKWDGTVLVGGTVDEFAAYAKKHCGAEVRNGAHAAGHAYVEYGKPWLLWVESLKNIPELAHECLHVTSGILEGRGVKHTDASEEAYTYTMEAILRGILRAKPSQWQVVK